MDEFFLIRIATSFVVGGIYIVFIARLAELFGSAVGGAAASTPTTMFIGNIFLGITEGKQALFESVPGTLLGMTATLLMLMVFVALNRQRSFELSLAAGIAIWFTCVVFLKLVVGSSALVAALIYLAVSLVAYLYFRNIVLRPPAPSPTNRKMVMFRILLAGSVVASIVITARLAGGFWSGVAGGFPVMFLLGIYILEKSQGEDFTHSFIKMLPVGSLSVFSYINLIGLLSLKTGSLFAILISFVSSLVVSLVVYKASAAIHAGPVPGHE